MERGKGKILQKRVEWRVRNRERESKTFIGKLLFYFEC